ncbi:nitrogenase iron-molybdenum cofactor biosynthesis protein NifN [Azospirillum sp.]|uniref:nitrogenase iron-molybdenum cofactor biosynthesis protein NifN n=1 Tax=Azospirillum sp. TaxID=34012 RepID=UPI003D762527
MGHIQRFPTATKSVATNPLKMSQPIGAALAFLGMDRSLPLFHGSQGCTAFGLVLLVRHFREAIPLQTTAMDQVSTILGGYENLEEALKTIDERMKPALIGVATTGVTETKGEDLAGHLATFRQRNPTLAHLNLVFVNTPDFAGGFEDGFAAAVTGIVEAFAEPSRSKVKGQVNILAGCHLTPGDVEEIRDIVESFGLTPIILPDLSLSMSGRQPDDFTPTSLGGTTIDQVRAMGQSEATLVLGEQMRTAAAALELKTDVRSLFFDRLTGLEVSDRFVKALAEISGRPVPARLRRQRESLVDAMLDGHFYTARKRVVVALEPDLLHAVTGFLADLGVQVVGAVSPTQAPVLEKLRAGTVLVGDHADAEALAEGCDLIISNSHGRQGAARAGVELFRMGLPQFDRLGAGLTVSIGYRGSRDLLFALANRFLAQETEHHAGDAHDCHGGGGCGCSAG